MPGPRVPPASLFRGPLGSPVPNRSGFQLLPPAAASPVRASFPLAFLPCGGKGRPIVTDGWRSAERAGTRRTVGQGWRQRGLSARALCARFHGASLGPPRHSATALLLRARFCRTPPLDRKMRRGGSRREPALSPSAAVGDTFRGRPPAFSLRPTSPPRAATQSRAPSGGRYCSLSAPRVLP